MAIDYSMNYMTLTREDLLLRFPDPVSLDVILGRLHSQGWELVSTHQGPSFGLTAIHYIFRKLGP